MDDFSKEQVSKVPLLGDIPLVGQLFRYTSTERAKRNLMVLIRPTISVSTTFIAHCQKKKYTRYRQEQQQRIDGKSKALVGSEDLPVLDENTFNSHAPRHRHGEAFIRQFTHRTPPVGRWHNELVIAIQVRLFIHCRYAIQRLLDIQRQVGQRQTMTSLSQADFEARLEAVFHQNTGESHRLRRISINPSIFTLSEQMPANARSPRMKISGTGYPAD